MLVTPVALNFPEARNKNKVLIDQFFELTTTASSNNFNIAKLKVRNEIGNIDGISVSDQYYVLDNIEIPLDNTRIRIPGMDVFLTVQKSGGGGDPAVHCKLTTIVLSLT